jgi:hypothetical protein
LLYSFAGTPDGQLLFAGLIFDNAGSLYGTTKWWRAAPFRHRVQADALGRRPVDGNDSLWISGAADGGASVNGVVLDSDGNLYGTTPIGGIVPYGQAGVVFDITP